MAESLLTHASIKLFGRAVNSLVFTFNAAEFVSLGNNNFLQQQLTENTFNITATTVTGALAVGAVAPNTNGLRPFMTVVGAGIPTGAFITPPATTITLNGFNLSVAPQPGAAGTALTVG